MTARASRRGFAVFLAVAAVGVGVLAVGLTRLESTRAVAGLASLVYVAIVATGFLVRSAYPRGPDADVGVEA